MRRLLFIWAALLCGIVCISQSEAFWQSRDSNYNIAISGAVLTAMDTPLITSAASPSNSATRYVGFAGGNAAGVTGTVANISAPIAIAGTISSLSVSLATTVTTGTWVVVLNKNGSDDASFKCSITSGTTCTYSATTVTVAAGDLLAWAVEPATTPTAQGFIQIAATLTATTGISALFAATTTGSPSTTVPNYTSFGGTGTSWQTAELLAENVVPTGGTIDNLFVATNGTPGTGTYTIAVNHNGSATSLTCTISSASPCSDTNGAHAFTVAAADTISVVETPSTAPTSRSLTVSARWTPTINGESLLFATLPGTLPALAATRFFNLNGAAIPTATEASFNTIAGSIFTVKKLFEQQQPQPGAGVTRTVTLRAGAASVGSPGNVSCTVAAGVGVTGTCSDTTNSYTTASTDLLDLQTSVSTNNTALTQFTVGAVAYVAPH